MAADPSKRRDAAARTQYAVDQYKSRSIWGAWRGLPADVRARYFGADELAWLGRYGARLDQLSCLAIESRNAREKHFVGACLHHHPPTTDRERLWLRALMVVRYEASLERAARCAEAERIAVALADRCRQLGADLRDCEAEVVSGYPRQWAVEAREERVEAQMQRLALRNVERVPCWVFRLGGADRPMFRIVR